MQEIPAARGLEGCPDLVADIGQVEALEVARGIVRVVQLAKSCPTCNVLLELVDFTAEDSLYKCRWRCDCSHLCPDGINCTIVLPLARQRGQPTLGYTLSLLFLQLARAKMPGSDAAVGNVKLAFNSTAASWLWESSPHLQQ